MQKTSKIKSEPFTKEDIWNELMDLEASVRKPNSGWILLFGLIL